MNKSMLMIGPLPPPLGGDTIVFKRLVNNPFLDDLSIKRIIIDTSRKGNIRLPNRKMNCKDIFNGLKIFFKFLQKIRKVDIILIYSNSRFLYTIGLIIILISKLFNKPIILKIFGGTFNLSFNKLPKLYKRIGVGILKRVGYILPQTEFLCSYFKNEIGIETSRVIHFPNFIPDSIIPDEKTDFKGLREKSELNCIFVGQIKAEKGVFDILNMLKNNSNIYCDFYGPFLDRDKKKFLNRIENIINAKYCGIINHEKVCSIISDYDILLLPSYHIGEGYPAVILEAFSVGKPVLTTLWRSLPELVEDRKQGFLIPIHDPITMGEKLQQLLSNIELYNVLCKGAKLRIRKFTEKVVIKKLKNIIKGLILNHQLN